MSGRSAPERLKIARQPEHSGVFRHIPIFSSLTLSRPHALADRMFREFVRPCDLCKRNSFCDLEPLPPRRKGVVQIPRRRHPGLGPEIITPRRTRGYFLDTINQNGIFGVALSVAYGRGTKPEYWESCRVLFQSKKRQIHDASSFRINQVIDEE
jgi:hypothetical protein